MADAQKGMDLGDHLGEDNPLQAWSNRVVASTPGIGGSPSHGTMNLVQTNDFGADMPIRSMHNNFNNNSTALYGRDIAVDRAPIPMPQPLFNMEQSAPSNGKK